MESIQFLIFLLFSLKQVYGIATHATFDPLGARSSSIRVEQKPDCDFYQVVTPGGKPGDPGFEQSRSRDHEGSASLPKFPQCGGKSELPSDYSPCPCAVKGQGTPQHYCLPTITVDELRQQPGFCPSDLRDGSLGSLLNPQYPSQTHDLLRSEGEAGGSVYGKPSDRNIGGESKGAFSMPSGFPSSNKETTTTDGIGKNGRDVPNSCGLYFS